MSKAQELALARARKEFPHVREQVREMYRRDPFFDPEVQIGNVEVKSVGEILREMRQR